MLQIMFCSILHYLFIFEWNVECIFLDRCSEGVPKIAQNKINILNNQMHNFN